MVMVRSLCVRAKVVATPFISLSLIVPQPHSAYKWSAQLLASFPLVDHHATCDLSTTNHEMTRKMTE